MKGKHQVIVKNARIQYKFSIERNITILRGDSATGKTTLIDMIYSYQLEGENSGVVVNSDKKCIVLTSYNWQVNLQQIHDSIIFIDEGGDFVSSVEFAKAIQNTDNYYVIVSRMSLAALPYSVNEIYGIKNKSGNRYQGTKRLYSEFYPLNDNELYKISKPDCVIVEDSNAGYEFFSEVFRRYNIPCIAASGKSNVFSTIEKEKSEIILVIADGASFGPELEKVLALRVNKKIILYLPESFEWIILKSGLIGDSTNILDEPYEHIESQKYFSWERFFTDLLVRETADSGYLRYSKNKLNRAYLQDKERARIVEVLPELDWK